MKYTGILILLLLSLFSISTAYTKQETNMTQDQQDILSVVKTMTNSFIKGDIKGVMNSYEKNAMVVFQPGEPVTDENVLKEMFQGAFKLNPKFEYPKGHQVFVTGDLAIHLAPWTMKGKSPDGQDINQQGLSIAVLRKQTNGKWLMVIDNPHGQTLMQ